MADEKQVLPAKSERKVSVTITVRIDSIGQLAALDLENKVRDAADDFGAEVLSNYSAERVFQLGA